MLREKGLPMPLEINEPAELLTTKEVAKIIGVIPRRVLQYIKEGRLEANKIGRPWFIRRSALDKFLATDVRKPGNLTGRPRISADPKPKKK